MYQDCYRKDPWLWWQNHWIAFQVFINSELSWFILWVMCSFRLANSYAVTMFLTWRCGAVLSPLHQEPLFSLEETFKKSLFHFLFTDSSRYRTAPCTPTFRDGCTPVWQRRIIFFLLFSMLILKRLNAGIFLVSCAWTEAFRGFSRGSCVPPSDTHGTLLAII